MGPRSFLCVRIFYQNHMGIQTIRTDGPVLSQTDLYLLNTELDVNPILEGKVPNYQLQFHLVTGLHR